MNPLATPSQPNAKANPHYVQMGGVDGITRLVERFYFHMNTQPQAAHIRAMHPQQLERVKRMLIDFLSEWMGGPKAYSVEHGHPRLRMKHMTFAIGVAERDAWMACMRAALAESVTDPQFRTQLEQAFFKTADFIRNVQEP